MLIRVIIFCCAFIIMTVCAMAPHYSDYYTEDENQCITNNYSYPEDSYYINYQQHNNYALESYYQQSNEWQHDTYSLAHSDDTDNYSLNASWHDAQEAQHESPQLIIKQKKEMPDGSVFITFFQKVDKQVMDTIKPTLNNRKKIGELIGPILKQLPPDAICEPNTQPPLFIVGGRSYLYCPCCNELIYGNNTSYLYDNCRKHLRLKENLNETAIDALIPRSRTSAYLKSIAFN